MYSHNPFYENAIHNEENEIAFIVKIIRCIFSFIFLIKLGVKCLKV